jgi:hypothetical protein
MRALGAFKHLPPSMAAAVTARPNVLNVPDRLSLEPDGAARAKSKSNPKGSLKDGTPAQPKGPQEMSSLTSARTGCPARSQVKVFL